MFKHQVRIDRVCGSIFFSTVAARVRYRRAISVVLRAVGSDELLLWVKPATETPPSEHLDGRRSLGKACVRSEAEPEVWKPFGKEVNMVEISRSKDGVPQWSGDAASYQEYEEQALQWEQSIAHGKRYLCGPRMIQEMSGTARKLVTGERPDWLSFNGGVVRRSLGRPQIPELSEYLNKYFKQSRRRKSMNQYIVRKTEVYQRAKQALARVLPHQQRNTGDDYRWQRSSWRSSLWRGSWQSSFTGQDDWTGGGQSHPDQGEPGSDPWAHELRGQTKMMKMSRMSFRTQLMDGRPIATTPQLSPTGGLVTKMKTGPMRHQSSCQNSSKDGISWWMPTSPALNATWFRPLSRETLEVSGLPRSSAHNGQRRTWKTMTKLSSSWQDDIEEDINYEYGQEFTRKELEWRDEWRRHRADRRCGGADRNCHGHHREGQKNTITWSKSQATSSKNQPTILQDWGWEVQEPDRPHAVFLMWRNHKIANGPDRMAHEATTTR